MGKAVGVGGVFLKAQDPKGLQKWYHEHLGVPLSEHGYTSFEGPETHGTTVFSFFSGGYEVFWRERAAGDGELPGGLAG